MKKANVLLWAALLLLGRSFAACNDSNDDPSAEMFPDGIKPVILEGKLGKELTDFFNENAGRIVGSIFPFPAAASHHEQEMWFMTDTCLMINSMEEFPTVDFRGESIEVPAIDFDAYTLVIGKYLDGSGSIIASQNLVVTPNKTTLNLLAKEPGDNLDEIRIYFFWALYPKIESKTIDLNVVHNKYM